MFGSSPSSVGSWQRGLRASHASRVGCSFPEHLWLHTCLYKGRSERAKREEEGKCKYLVHLCIAASAIKAREGYNYRSGSCAAQFSLVWRQAASGRRLNGTLGLRVTDEKIFKQPQKPWSFPVASDHRSQGVVIVVAHFQCAHTWLRPANFPCDFSELHLAARLALSQPTANFIGQLRLRLMKATRPVCSEAPRQ